MAAPELKPDSPYTRDQLEKLGNGIIYLAERIKPLYKTKLLKLLYLLDEGSVKRSGIPMFALVYRAWQKGPVAKEVFFDLSDSGGVTILKDYIRVVKDDLGLRIEGVKSFSDAEFSDRDMQLLDWLSEANTRASAMELVDLTHDKNSPWYQLALEKGLLEAFESGAKKTSDFVLDMSKLVAKDPEKSRIYADHQEFLRTHRALQG